MEPLIGLEPMTVRLQGECSTSWAIVAFIYIFCDARDILLKNNYMSKFFLKKIFSWYFLAYY